MVTMVTGELAILGTIFGAVIGGGIQHYSSKFRQSEENTRIRGEKFAEKEAEALISIGQELERCYRFYLVEARRASVNNIELEYYQSEVYLTHQSFLHSLERGIIFVGDDSEYQLKEVHKMMIQLDDYIRWTIDTEWEPESDDPDKALREGLKQYNSEYTLMETHMLYEKLKQDIRDTVTVPIIEMIE